MQLIDGKAIADQVKQEIAQEVAEIKSKGGKTPHLAVIIVGHDGGSETYVAHKVKSCEQVGFKSTKICFEDDITEDELLAQIEMLNNDADVDGFIVQLPLPKHISGTSQSGLERLAINTFGASIRYGLIFRTSLAVIFPSCSSKINFRCASVIEKPIMTLCTWAMPRPSLAQMKVV